MNIVQRCLEHGWRHICFIGTTKHAGKTTALNHFIRQAYHSGRRIGLCSIGFDGERLDTILGVAKPAIWVPEGTLVVSAERALQQSEAGFAYLEALPVTSPLGTVLLAKVTRAGCVTLAGIRQRQHVAVVMEKLTSYGVDFALVDGAFDRIAAAAPDLVDAAVLAVGAVSGVTVEAVVRHAASFIRRFQLAQADEALKDVLGAAHEAGTVGFWDGQKLSQTPSHEAVLGLERNASWSDALKAVYLPGALTDGICCELCGRGGPLDVVVGHPAQVMASEPALLSVFRNGHHVWVWTSMPLVAIAANPVSITGYTLPALELRAALAKVAGNTPVYDGAWDVIVE